MVIYRWDIPRGVFQGESLVWLAKMSQGVELPYLQGVSWGPRLVCALEKKSVDLTQSLSFAVVSRTYHLHSSSRLMHSPS